MGIEEEAIIEALKYSMEKQITVYDAYYIITAHKLNTHIYTADEKLLRKIGGEEIRHIADYKPKSTTQTKGSENQT